MTVTAPRRALASLTGLSVGDAFGDQFFPLAGRGLDPWTATPPGPWAWSDDTEMACSVVATLIRHGRVDQDALAASFAARMDVGRRYGAGTLELLEKVRDGVPWRTASVEGFGGNGSYGNGAAMRAAPLGAFFAGDLRRAAGEAAASAEVTHAHPEGVAGAVAVAVAAAHVATPAEPQRPDLFDAALDHLAPGHVRRGVEAARELGGVTVEQAAARLGNGSRITAPDTVPFTLWLAARYLDDYETAVRACAVAGGDIDTTAAIVGGIVEARAGGAPDLWRRRREPLPDWLGHHA
ncbi:ADP-ribosylglycohydrolase family protein [Actinoallomurus purpureus]|uniref:ADP-ribosylglycohydrolase family protein n=1 Tax=Actinoallomurus purpureus TaxID=478114 RepID=UPI002093858B|nr:ADP-ribosylglycohydrolase family protein [Actinoallomurus purpureus]MCO6004101.1 ADP-ribosylglycohydrolase family protein [Actinoallomurus purpureus]